MVEQPVRRRLWRSPSPSRAALLDRSQILELQRLAGNAAVAGALRGFAVQRCGGAYHRGCSCNGEPEPHRDPLALEGEHRTLRQGAVGDDVKEAQAKLNLAGASPTLEIDGHFGPLTTASVQDFQSGHGLAVDGVVGQNTWASLDSTTPMDTDEDATGGDEDTFGPDECALGGGGDTTLSLRPDV